MPRRLTDQERAARRAEIERKVMIVAWDLTDGAMPTLDQVAGTLRCSRRGLEDRLTACGSSWLSIKNRVRRIYVENALKQRSASRDAESMLGLQPPHLETIDIPPGFTMPATIDPRVRARLERESREVRDQSIAAYLAAVQAWVRCCADNLALFIDYRREVTEAQSGGQRVTQTEMPAFKAEVSRLAALYGPRLVAQAEQIPAKRWTSIADWFTIAVLGWPLPELVAHLGAACARDIDEALATFKVRANPNLLGRTGDAGTAQHNPLDSARWPQSGFMFNGKQWAHQMSPTAAAYVTVQLAARQLDRRDIERSAA